MTLVKYKWVNSTTWVISLTFQEEPLAQVHEVRDAARSVTSNFAHHIRELPSYLLAATVLVIDHI